MNMSSENTTPWQALRGRFIVLDGPDGAGKSTQLALLAEVLRGGGLEVVTVRDPGGTAIGDRIRAILLDKTHMEMAVACELMLYMASRAQLVAQEIRPALERGACVLCDRYISSTIAYQGAGGADVAAIRSVGDVAVGGLWPALTIILDLPADVGLARVGKRGTPGTFEQPPAGAANDSTPAGEANTNMDRMELKGLEFHRRVRQGFLAQAAAQPDRFAVVDATCEPGQVHKAIVESVAKFLSPR